MGQERRQTVSLFIVCDVRVYRETLAATLSGCAGLCVRGASCLDHDTLLKIAAAAPELVVVDVACRQRMELFDQLHQRTPATKLVVFGVDESEPEILAYAEAGCAGYVHRDASIEELAATITSLAREELICSPRIAATLFRRIGSLAVVTGRGDHWLTLREREVLALIREGLSNKEIADRLRIAEPTVKNHVHNLLEKLQVKRRTQAAVADDRVARRKVGPP
jgi:two-component system, NarL family, nitrate/nitrite response regulator NarL